MVICRNSWTKPQTENLQMRASHTNVCQEGAAAAPFQTIIFKSPACHLQGFFCSVRAHTYRSRPFLKIRRKWDLHFPSTMARWRGAGRGGNKLLCNSGSNSETVTSSNEPGLNWQLRYKDKTSAASCNWKVAVSGLMWAFRYYEFNVTFR